MHGRPDISKEEMADPAAAAADQQTRRKRRGRWLLAGLLVLVPMLAITCGWTAWYAYERGRFEREVAAARERGEPVYFRELKPPPIPPEDNAAPLIMAAGALCAELELSVLHMHLESALTAASGQAPTVGHVIDYPFNGDLLAELQRHCDKHQPALLKLEQALQRPSCRFEIDYESENPILLPIDYVPRMRSLGRLLSVRCVVCLQADDLSGASQAIDGILRLSDSLQSYPSVDSYFMRLSLAGSAMRQSEIRIGSGSLSNAERAEWDARLAKLDAGLQCRSAVLAERAAYLTTSKNLRYSDLEEITDSQRAYTWSLLVPLQYRERTFATTQWGQIAAVIDLEDDVSRAKLLEFADGVERAPAQFVLMRLLAPPFRSLHLGSLRVRQHARNLRLALRVDAWMRRHGELPPSLEAVLDDALPKLPIDLESGLPLVLKPIDGGFIIYGFGFNRQDDGGRLAPESDYFEKGSSVVVCYDVLSRLALRSDRQAKGAERQGIELPGIELRETEGATESAPVDDPTHPRVVE